MTARLLILSLTLQCGASLCNAQTSTVTELAPIHVVGEPVEIEAVSELIDPALGASTYTITQEQINHIAQGENTSFNQILARTPGVSNDTYGVVHFRNEDPYYRYYINGTLLPAGINGFAQDIDTRLVQSVTTQVGALTAFYPEGNYGIIDITTKSGAELKGGELSFYGGSNDTIHPSLSYGGTSHGTDFYFTGSYVHNNLGLENPAPGTSAVHDETNQYRGLVYVSHRFEDAGRLSFLFSGSDADFRIPNNELTTSFPFLGIGLLSPPVNSASLNETQNEQTYYGFVAYQQNFDDWSFQISQVDRLSTIKFNPDVNGDLFYNGVAASIKDYNVTNSLLADFTGQPTNDHTVRFGVLGDTQSAGANNFSTVYPTDNSGNLSGTRFSLQDDHSIRAYDYAVYAQDEWRATDKLTINYGLRWEQVKGYSDESQLSPRLNFVYQFNKETTVHAGYARYFDPPPLLNISSTHVRQFANTSNAPEVFTNDPIKVEKSHYFDLGASHDFLPGLEVGVDAYYKLAHDQIDDGQFGAANISSPYNFATASMYGIDFSVAYTHDNLTAYGNFEASDSWGKGIASSQFEFGSDELAAIGSNNTRFDQQQSYTASIGASYKWLDTTFHTDAIYGDGIRRDPFNRNKLTPYYPVNFGIEHVFPLGHSQAITLRFDVLNLFDQIYVLNDGTGIGEGAVKYGNRRAFFGGISYSW